MNTGGRQRLVRRSGRPVAVSPRASAETSFTYFVEAPDSTGSDDFGPAEVNPGDGWVSVGGTSDRNTVVGQST